MSLAGSSLLLDEAESGGKRTEKEKRRMST